MGLHRKGTAGFNPIESELRKRIFWVVRSLDVYVSTLLGLPMMLSNKDIDQEYPLEVDDEYITPATILTMPSDRLSLMAGSNAYARLININVKIVKYIYPVAFPKHQARADQTYLVSYSKIKEIEKDLAGWTETLPPALRPSGDVSPKFERSVFLLRRQLRLC